MTTNQLISSDYIKEFTLHMDVYKSVKEHRQINGITPNSVIRQQKIKTFQFCRTTFINIER